MEYQYQPGFMPPMVAPFITGYDSQFDSDLSRDASPNLNLNPENYNSISNNSFGENASVDEEERKRIRRERNKQAAARCRQRRIEYTNKLARETEELQLGNVELWNTLHELMQQKAHMEAMLETFNKNSAFV
ncbi:fos-related antigen 2-like [Tetranychus urticae]|uniref:BZIP domain-containing protein n=1 Tax=Tetranychus urticae TaxID=32264 RepID=T1KTL6_TETUR|nr:fos-related antigen 2-like [Tetranychus urticae]